MSEILGSLGAAVRSNGHSEEYLQAVVRRFRVQHVFAASSGRAALWLILKSLRRLCPDRDVVAVPAYTCFSVPASVVRAGLKIHPVDVNPLTLDFDRSQLAELPHRLLCILGCNLFGFPNDFSVIREAARDRGAYVIDDAAQALGATRDGRFAGSLGDIGLYSLGRGKGIGSIEGGLIVTNSDEIASAVEAERTDLKSTTLAHGAKLILGMIAYSIFLRPRLFWLPNSARFLRLGITEYDTSFPTKELHAVSLALLPRLLERLSTVNETRRANAKAIAEALGSSPKLDFPGPSADSSPAFLRLPVIATDSATRERAIYRLRSAGIGATAFYPSAICDIPDAKAHMTQGNMHCVQAEWISQRLFTLPVHPNVSLRDVGQMVEVLQSL